MNAIESLAYLVKECPSVFNPIKEEFEIMKKENEQHKAIIDSLGKQLAIEKLERFKNVSTFNTLGKELAETKLKDMGGK